MARQKSVCMKTEINPSATCMSSLQEPKSSSGNTSSRNDFLDLVKGWLIFLVVLGHSIQFLGYRSIAFDVLDAYYFNPVYIGIYSFHMALFMGISGYLAWGAIRKRSFLEFTKVRLLQIVIPLLIWSSLRHMAGPTAKSLATQDLILLVNGLASFPILELGEEMWFLWAVFIAGLIVSAGQAMGEARFLAFFCGWVILLLLPQGEVIKLTAFTYPFFVIGYLMAEKRLSKLPPLAVLLGAFGIWCVTLVLWKPTTFAYVSGMDWREYPLDLCLRFVGGVAGSLVFLTIVWWLSKRWKPQIVILFGKESLAIYIVQTYLFFPLMNIAHPLRGWNHFAVTLAPVFAVLVCCFCVFIAWAIRKNRYTAALLLGAPLPQRGSALRS
jgi:fucose 4-O-acetylase-like acetyltransferase